MHETMSVMVIGMNATGSVVVDCGETAFVFESEEEHSTWKLCTQRDFGYWRNGTCRVTHYLDLINIQAAAFSTFFQRFPVARSILQSVCLLGEIFASRA